MKKYAIEIYIIIGVILLVCIMIFATLSIVYDNSDYNVETQTTITQVKLLDRHITIDNEYEILYAVTYSNGLTLQVWKQVNYNDYIELWEENKYDENCFKN